MRRPWDKWNDPVWRAAELAHFEAARERIRLDIRRHRLQLKVAQAELAEVEARHALELARTASLEPVPRSRARSARGLFDALERREAPVRLADAKLELARAAHDSAMAAAHEPDSWSELWQRECDALRAVYAAERAVYTAEEGPVEPSPPASASPPQGRQ